MEKTPAKVHKPEVRDPLTDEIIEEERMDPVLFLTWGTKAFPEKDSTGEVRYHPSTIAYCQTLDGQVVMVWPEWLIFTD